MAGGLDGILFDNDALSLLAAAGLVSHTLAILRMPASRAYRLESLTHMLRRRRIGKHWADGVRETALQEAHRVQVWRHQPDADLLQRLVDVDGIDDGEAVLFASLVEHPTMIMATGDRRSLQALCEASHLSDVRAAIAGRVVCLETLLQALVDGHSVATVGQAFQPVRAHRTLSVVFTSVTIQDEAQCRFVIESYLNDLKGAVGEGFLFEIRTSHSAPDF